MAQWRLLTNHGLVLAYLGQHPDSTGVEIGQAVGITERAARTIVAHLAAAGLVAREKVGRRNRYRIDPARPVRLIGERAVPVGAVLAMVWQDERHVTRPAAPGATPPERAGGQPTAR